MSHRQPGTKWLRALLVGSLLVPAALEAQSYARLDLGGFLEVGGEAERYARVLQLAGLAQLTPFSIQPFSPTQDKQLRPKGPNPWEKRFVVDSGRREILRPSARLIGNSGFPYQVGIGPTWTGRGVTGEIQAGAAAAYGPFSVQVAPLGFVAQNAAFTLIPTGVPGNGIYRDPRFPFKIDAPQRFGDKAYARLNGGQSWLAADKFGLFAALTTAPQQWGPARDYPLVLGPNAGGFPALLLGSSAPWDIWIAKIHGRLVYGRLAQSSFAADSPTPMRLGEGIIGVIEPRGLPGLEIGATRFLHRTWDDRSLAALERPFSGVFTNSTGLNNEASENGLGSVFARLAVPAARVEFYGEYYKEDYTKQFHQGSGSLVELPDDLGAYEFGFQHLLSVGAARIIALSGELVNGETSAVQRLERGLNLLSPPYIHFEEVQGHTLNGLILGSPEAYGGAGWRIGVDEFTAGGRRSVHLERSLRLDWLPGDTVNQAGRVPDVLYAVRVEWLRFMGGRDLGVSLIPGIELNRNLVARKDAFNLAISFSARGWP